jgi:ATP-dependent HslUV protease ATP-binding subunit HslU
MRKKLRSGKMNDQIVEIDINSSNPSLPMMQVFGGANMEELDNQLQGLFGNLLNKKDGKKKKVTIADAQNILNEQEAEKLLDQDKVNREAVRRTEEMGIIFIDEIDKIAGKENRSGADISREGVQRDLLPIVEGATVNTKIGPIKTDHILFIAAGAFHMSKPSDLIPELQGRFPIRVELEKLGMDDFKKILSAPRSSLMKQYQALLGVEGVQLEFTEDGLDEIAKIAFEVNEKNENIGARRLNTILEKVVEEISFNAPDLPADEKIITINRDFVLFRLKDIVENRDLSRYIL